MLQNRSLSIPIYILYQCNRTFPVTGLHYFVKFVRKSHQNRAKYAEIGILYARGNGQSSNAHNSIIIRLMGAKDEQGSQLLREFSRYTCPARDTHMYGDETTVNLRFRSNHLSVPKWTGNKKKVEVFLYQNPNLWWIIPKDRYSEASLFRKKNHNGRSSEGKN